MIALIQRVTSAEVVVAGDTIARIGLGMLAFIGVRKSDTERNAQRMVERLLGYRIFQDARDRMNLPLHEVEGGLLLVPQFTLAADTRKGTRAGFSAAAEPEQAHHLFLETVALARVRHPRVASGQFGAEMSVSLVNHGPVTFWLEA